MTSEDFDIITKGLTKSFANIQALKGIDLKVKKGEFITIFGPNGAGKTTLIKILSTLSKPTGGSVIISKNDLKKEPQKVRRVVGVISHEPYLYGGLSALENICLFATMYGISNPKERSIEVIMKLGLENRMHDLVGTFSSGMKQRLAVARAIVHDPSVLLLDEPFTGLDQHGIKILRDMLSILRSQDRTILMTTHNISEGLDLSDRVLILSRGEIVYEGITKGLEGERFKEIYLQKVAG